MRLIHSLESVNRLDKKSQASSERYTMDRWPYFCWGAAMIAVKYNLDRAIAVWGFNRQWFFWNYIKPHGFAAIDALPPDDEKFYMVLLITSLPFLVLGIALTLRRLRSAGLPLALCLLFFAPAVNLIFFFLLGLVPAKSAALVPLTKPWWDSWIPASEIGSAMAGTVIVGLFGGILACLSTALLQNYGWGLFVALPFAMGLISVLIYTAPRKRSFGRCMTVALLPVGFAGLLLFAAAVEGALCLAMAAPIGAVLAMLGGAVGYIIAGRRHASISPPAMMLILFSVPFTMGMEKQANDAPPLLSVTTSVMIDAPPERVWPNVISFPLIPDRRDWILAAGIAYPIEARMDGQGSGAIRHCVFSTGEFVEPIEVWDENHLLRFSVAGQPEPMEELSPYPRLRTPHLHGYLISREGELRLTALPGGKTLLEGTTWYTDQIWPSRYWQIWSDTIIHHIHLRVLNHIKNLSEQRTTAVLP